MYKFVIDSDALIKLTKTGLLEQVCRHYNCAITSEVKEESVDEGKKRFYKDALKIEELIGKKLLKVIELKKAKSIKGNFGKGEVSSISLYFQEKNSTLVTDDSAFIRYLEEENVSFILPADIILLMKRSEEIDEKTALDYLEKMKHFIREEVYNDVKKEIGRAS